MSVRRWQDTQLFILPTISCLPVEVTGFGLWVTELLASIFHIYPTLVAFPHQFHSFPYKLLILKQNLPKRACLCAVVYCAVPYDRVLEVPTDRATDRSEYYIPGVIRPQHCNGHYYWFLKKDRCNLRHRRFSLWRSQWQLNRYLLVLLFWMKVYEAMQGVNELTIMNVGFLECGEDMRVGKRARGVKLFREMGWTLPNRAGLAKKYLIPRIVSAAVKFVSVLCCNLRDRMLPTSLTQVLALLTALVGKLELP